MSTATPVFVHRVAPLFRRSFAKAVIEALEPRRFLSVGLDIDGSATVPYIPLAGTTIDGVLYRCDVGAGVDLTDKEVTVDWGDGTTSVATFYREDPDTFALAGTHTYKGSGTFGVNLQLAEDGQLLTQNVPQIISRAESLNDVVQYLWTPISYNRANTDGPFFVGTFYDTNPLPVDQYAVSIDWGDGAVSGGSLQQGWGNVNVDGEHVFAKAGIYQVTYTVSRPDGTSLTASHLLNWIDHTDTSAADYEAFSGDTFHTPSPVTFPPDALGGRTFEEVRAIIDWGDGTQNDVAIYQAENGDLNVYLNHVFAEAARHRVTVSLIPGDNTDPNRPFVGIPSRRADVSAIAQRDLIIDVGDGAFQGAGRHVEAGAGAPLTDILASFREKNGSIDASDYLVDFGLVDADGKLVWIEEGAGSIAVSDQTIWHANFPGLSIATPGEYSYQVEVFKNIGNQELLGIAFGTITITGDAQPPVAEPGEESPATPSTPVELPSGPFKISVRENAKLDNLVIATIAPAMTAEGADLPPGRIQIHVSTFDAAGNELTFAGLPVGASIIVNADGNWDIVVNGSVSGAGSFTYSALLFDNQGDLRAPIAVADGELTVRAAPTRLDPPATSDELPSEGGDGELALNDGGVGVADELPLPAASADVRANFLSSATIRQGVFAETPLIDRERDDSVLAN